MKRQITFKIWDIERNEDKIATKQIYLSNVEIYIVWI